jgi:hypothetical protein
MSARIAKRRLWIVIVAVALVMVAVIAFLNREALGLAVAIASAESRPELLRDAEWSKRGTARQFERQFRPGNSEADLLSWLSANRFAIDRSARRAQRRVASLPCNETIGVAWATSSSGLISSATAEVTEAGCL